MGPEGYSQGQLLTPGAPHLQVCTAQGTHPAGATSSSGPEAAQASPGHVSRRPSLGEGWWRRGLFSCSRQHGGRNVTSGSGGAPEQPKHQAQDGAPPRPLPDRRGSLSRLWASSLYPWNLGDHFQFTLFPQLQFTSQEAHECHPAGSSPGHARLRMRPGTSGQPGRPCVCPQGPSAACRRQQVRPRGRRRERGVLREAAPVRSPPKDSKSCALCRRLRVPDLRSAGPGCEVHTDLAAGVEV